MMNRKQIDLRGLFIAVAFAAVFSLSFRQLLKTESAYLTGLVTVNGIPLQSAKLKLIRTNRDSTSTEVSATTTDVHGHYRIDCDLLSGDFTVQVMDLGEGAKFSVPREYGTDSCLRVNLCQGGNIADLEMYIPETRTRK